ncbi:hypothetical protein VTN31DRAFT_1854 [Thermomyces dupontii]|uniref:uncharacterized protein n=1 Tax=Talaromyces thermophilus TaxID=28565 RepID=UPI003743879E
MTSRPPSAQNTNRFSFSSTTADPPSPRRVRKFQSHQTLPSVSSAAFFQSQQPPPTSTSTSRASYYKSNNQSPQQAPAESPAQNRQSRRPRSNSDAGSSHNRSAPLATEEAAAPRPQRSARKAGSAGHMIRRSNLGILLRDGPSDGKLRESLQKLRLLVLSDRVDADSDGMSTYRIYLWLALLAIPPYPTDEYLALVHRGRSPAYAKIRNDTFRTLATDPLFKRRVTEASLIRLLNAVAWKLHDAQEAKPNSRPSSRRKEMLELAIDNPPTIVEEPEAEYGQVPGTHESKTKSAIYVQGMNVLCAPFLYAARSEVEAFALFYYFITKECPGYVRGAMDGVHRGLRLVDQCLQIVDPKLSNYLFSKGMYAELYAFPSVLTLCACTPPLPEVLHLWDFLFAYGPHLNILCIVAQLNRMRDVIMQSESPNKVLRSFPPLDAEKIISLTVSFVRKIPADLYAELVDHAK